MKRYVKIFVIGMLIAVLIGCSNKSEVTLEEPVNDHTSDYMTENTGDNTEAEESTPTADEDETKAEYIDIDPRLIVFSNFLQDIISGKVSKDNDEGMFFDFADASDPGFAFYYNDHILLVTDNINDPKHKYSVYYMDDNNNLHWGISPTGYIPNVRWIVEEGNTKKMYIYESRDGFELRTLKEYPEDDSGEVRITSYYVGMIDDEGNKEILEDTSTLTLEKDWEYNESREIHEPEDLKWISLTKETVEAVKSDQEKITELQDQYMSDKLQKNKDIYVGKYQDLIFRIVNDYEPINGEGETYDFSTAPDPGYALYDIDKDGIDELFITGDKNNQWHTYTVYYYKNAEIVTGETLNGFIPGSGLWTYGFEYATDAFSYDHSNGFSRAWEIEYPVDDEDVPIMIKYAGKTEQAISDDELNEILSGKITEPGDLEWNKLTKDMNLLEQ